MKKLGSSAIYTALLVVLSIHMASAMSIGGIRKCSHLMVEIAPCMPYVNFPPQNHSGSPPSACCRPLLTSASFQPSANSTEVCLCLLFNNPVLLGFPVDIRRMRTLLSQCHFKNYADIDSVCRGLPIAPPPPHDNGNSNLPPIRITGPTDLSVPFSQTLVLFSYFAAFILMIVDPIVVILTQEYEVGTTRINIVNALYFILTSIYCLMDGSALGKLEAYSNFLRAILEMVVIVMHVLKMPSMKEVSKQVSLIVFGSLAFCASFYYFYESMTEKNRRFLFGWASTGICEVLLLAQTKQLRMRIHNLPTSISIWTAIRFILGAASYFFWFLLGILGSTDEKDWPTIVAGASGVIVGTFQCCHFLPSQCSCASPHPEPEALQVANSSTNGMGAGMPQHFPGESSGTSFYWWKTIDNWEESIDNAENQEQKLRKLEKRVEYQLTQDEDSLVEKFMTEYETKPDELRDIFTRVSTTVSVDDLHGQLHGKWMDTVIMDCWLGIVREQFPNAYFFPSIVWVMYLDWNEVFNPPTGHQWEDYDTLLFPLWEENHFFLIVAYPKEKRWEYYNSIGWSEKNWKCAHKIREFVCSTFRSRGLEILEEWTMENVDSCPLQNNGSDCGVFVMAIAEHVARRQPLVFTQADIGYFRRKIVHDVYSRQLELHSSVETKVEGHQMPLQEDILNVNNTFC